MNHYINMPCNILRFNPLVTNGLSNPYHLDESTFILGASKFFHFQFIFQVSKQNSPRWDAAFCGVKNAASHLGLFCLPMSHKKDARLIWVNGCKMRVFSC